MKIGLIGYSQSGKTTLFQAITGVEPDLSAGLKPQSGLAMVEDDRLDFLASLYNPKKKTFANVEFVDTPGLDKKDEALNSKLGTIKNVDAFIFVMDAFSQTDISDSLRSFKEELLLSDIVALTNRVEKLEDNLKKGKSQNKDADSKEAKELRVILSSLESGEKVDINSLSQERIASLRGFQLFSLKPSLILINVDESSLNKDPSSFISDKELLESVKDNVCVLSAKLELELASLDKESLELFMNDLGIDQIARHKLIKESYKILGLSSFFTVGEDECKAWTIHTGDNAVVAASKIHSDIARGFIRAEVVDFNCMKELKSMKEIKAKGLYRLEGKEYKVKDGDIINFRFNV